MASVREDIITAVIAEMNKIDGTGSFETSVDIVYTHDILTSDSDASYTKILGVFSGRQDSIRQSELQFGATTENLLEVVVRGLVRDTRTNARTESDKLMADIERAVFDDKTLGLTDVMAMNRIYDEPAEEVDGEGTSIRLTCRLSISYVSELGTP